MANIPRTTLFEFRRKRKFSPIMKTVMRFVDIIIVPDPFITQESVILKKRKKYDLESDNSIRLYQPDFPFIQCEMTKLRKINRINRRYNNLDEQFNRPQAIPAPVIGFSPTLSFVLNVTRTLTFTKEMITEDV